jgi:hypothetical protein
MKIRLDKLTGRCQTFNIKEIRDLKVGLLHRRTLST